MKRKSRQLAALLTVVVLITAVYGGVRIYKAKQAKAETERQTYRVSALAELASVVIYNGDETLSFYYDAADGKWIYEELRDFPVSSLNFSSLGLILRDLTAIREIPASDNLAAYGLAVPERTLAATDASGNSIELLVGVKSGDGENYYAMKKGGDVIYTVPSALRKCLDHTLYDMIEVENFPLVTDRSLQAITVETRDGLVRLEKTAVPKTEEELGSTLYKTDPDHYFWYLVNADGSKTAVEDLQLTPPEDQAFYTGKTYANALVEAVKGGSFQICVDYKASEETLAEHGLDDPLLSVTVEYIGRDGSGGEAPAAFTLLIGGFVDKGGDEDYFFAKLQDSTQLSIFKKSALDPVLDLIRVFPLKPK